MKIRNNRKLALFIALVMALVYFAWLPGLTQVRADANGGYTVTFINDPIVNDTVTVSGPSISIDGRMLTINRVDNFTRYTIYAFDEHGNEVGIQNWRWSSGTDPILIDLSRMLLNPNDYQIRVAVFNDDWEPIAEKSNPVLFTQPGPFVTLDAPVINGMDGAFITWEAVPNAAAHDIFVFNQNNEPVTIIPSSTRTYLNVNQLRGLSDGNYTLQVEARGDWITTVGRSEWSEPFTVTLPLPDDDAFKRLATPKILLEGTILRLVEPVRGAGWYDIYINGVRVAGQNLPVHLVYDFNDDYFVDLSHSVTPGALVQVRATHHDQFVYNSILSAAVTMPGANNNQDNNQDNNDQNGGGTETTEPPAPPPPAPSPSPSPEPTPEPEPEPEPVLPPPAIEVSTEAITEAAEIIVDQRTGAVTVEIEMTEEITEAINTAVEAALEAVKDLAAYIAAARDTATEAGDEYDETDDVPEFITVSLNITEMFADLLGNNENLTTVSLPAEIFEAIAEAEEVGLELAMPAGTITFDPGALASAVTQAEGSHISATMESLHIPDIPQNQRRYVRGNETIVRVAFSSGDEAIRNFDGYISVTVPYAGPFPAAVWLLDDDGILHRMPAAYCEESKTVTFQSNRFSLFVIGEAPPEEAAVEATPPAGPATVAINSRDTASNGAQAVVTVNGSHFINLRYMMEEVLDGVVESTRAAGGERLAVFSANHAAGAKASITIAGTYPNATVTATLNETPMLVAARVIDGSWYVILQTFAQMYGFLPELM
ncbi:MAG: hypothetical protein FWE90_14260 [Defluviitaleaceae bacterium]|nr:hypothetical protein [Defluviitaleaceae bacterium]